MTPSYVCFDNWFPGIERCEHETDASYQVELVSVVAVFLPLSVCVKSSEVLVSLVSCTINTESVLNLRIVRRRLIG